MKICIQPTCHKKGKPQPLTEYYDAEDHLDGTRGTCKTCNKLQQKKWRKENRKHDLRRKKEYREKHPELIKERMQKWRLKKKIKALEQAKNSVPQE